MENEKLNEKPWKEEIYFHVCNGGATISIEQSEYGAKIKVRTGSYGNCETTTEVTTNNRGIETLKGMFERASKKDFKVNDCYSLAYVPKDPKESSEERGAGNETYTPSND